MKNINFVDTDYNDDHAASISVWVENAIDEFADSKYFKQLRSNEQDDCSFLLSTFFDNCYSYCLVGPGKLSKHVIDEVMLDILPRKISAEQSVFEALAPIMDNFLCWCEDEKYIAKTADIRNHIQSRSGTMIAYSQDPKRWGMAKSIVMSGAFNFNQENNLNDVLDVPSPIETYHREHAKIGRNDPCYCGSGKKYKKCCLNN
jgi:hypothetical protein